MVISPRHSVVAPKRWLSRWLMATHVSKINTISFHVLISEPTPALLFKGAENHSVTWEMEKVNGGGQHCQMVLGTTWNGSTYMYTCTHCEHIVFCVLSCSSLHFINPLHQGYLFIHLPPPSNYIPTLFLVHHCLPSTWKPHSHTLSPSSYVTPRLDILLCGIFNCQVTAFPHWLNAYCWS